MRVFMAILAAAAVTSMTGCAMSPDIMTRQDDMDVCRSYGIYANSPMWRATADGYEQEINRRGLLSTEEWQLARSKKIRQGMSQCALYASWGKPDRENRSVGSWGVHIQHVYNAGYRYIQPSYVYTENGKVRSWQD